MRRGSKPLLWKRMEDQVFIYNWEGARKINPAVWSGWRVEWLELSGGDTATYEAEFLFNLDFNGDGVQGRNTSLWNELGYHQAKKLTIFEQSNKTDLHQDLNSQELLTSEDGSLSARIEFAEADGESLIPGASQRVIAAEVNGEGNFSCCRGRRQERFAFPE